MSEIFLATQSGLAGFNKLVVLKTILPDIGGEEDFVRMFLDEARTTAAFNHPNIAQVYELDVADGQLFMAMEFVQGCTLVEMARACRLAKVPIPVGFTLQAVRDTALALHYAHNFTDPRGRRQIVIHRDVAEKNIMVTYEGVTKLLDFGIAKALGRANRTSVGMVKGTSGYMSPEQIRGEPLDGRSDIFALGVVLHECLTGMRLFHGKKPEDGMLAALKETVAPPSKLNSEVSPEVDAVVMRSLARNREERFATALEMARAIERAAPGGIWHPEQTAELVTKHFVERREETRRLLEGTSYGRESTGEMRIDSLMAKVKASQSLPDLPRVGPAELLPTPAPAIPPVSSPTPTPQVPSRASSTPNALPKPAVSAPSAAPVPVPSSPSQAKRADAIGRAGEQVSTAPARPKVLKEDPKPINLPGPHPSAGRPPTPSSFNDFNDDDSEAKTIPAAALPDDIKALRQQLQERRAAELAKQAAEKAGEKPRNTEPGVVPAFSPAAASPSRQPVKATPDKPAPAHAPVKARTPDKPATAHTPLSEASMFPSGEEQSVTTRGDEAPDPNDFEDDGLTNVAQPEWQATSEERPAVTRKSSRASQQRGILIAIIVVSLLIAAACVVMFAFDLLPNDVPKNMSTPGQTGVPAPVPAPKATR